MHDDMLKTIRTIDTETFYGKQYSYRDHDS